MSSSPQGLLSMVYNSAFAFLLVPSFSFFSPPSFVDCISLLNLSPCSLFLTYSLPPSRNLPPLSLSSLSAHFCFLWSVKNDCLQDEVDRIRRRNGLTKWIAAFLAIHHHSEATAGLLITSCNYKVSDSVLVALRTEGGVGVWERWLAAVEGNAGSCSTLKNPPLIDFKWWNIDFCLVQGPAELAATICRRYNAGHPFLLATISHTDTGKNEQGGKGGKGGEK